MRLSEKTVKVLQNAFLATFQEGELYLFGSRVSDERRGGDIDLYIIPQQKHQLGEKRIAFLAQVKREIGE